ncbi:MAG: RDD family protein [Lentisphaerae bacterium]|nr:RDD family protein [Lentisphaerota bacterium]
MKWFYAAEGESSAPLTEADFQAKIEDGTITADTLVWHEGMAEWEAYASAMARPAAEDANERVEEESDGLQPCCECGTSSPVDDLIRYENSYVCANCKTLFFQRLEEGAALPGVLEYGGFWIRVGAKIIDGLLLGAVSLLLSFVAGMFNFTATANDATGTAFAVQMVLWVIQMLVGLSYTVFFLGRYAATPGKMACKLTVIRSDGAPITYSRAAGRHFAEMLSGLLLNIGYLMAAFDDEKRTLHDRICDTRVIRIQ